jgi:hypothetical protein
MQLQWCNEKYVQVFNQSIPLKVSSFVAVIFSLHFCYDPSGSATGEQTSGSYVQHDIFETGSEKGSGSTKVGEE